MQDDRGNVALQFSKREWSSSRISTQGIRTSSSPRLSFEINSRRSSIKLDNVDFTPNIPHPRYITQESPPTCPTRSQIMHDEPNQLMVIESSGPFKIDKQYLRKELHLPKNDQKRKWFFSREAFRDEWYKCMEKNRIDIPMFTYFEMYTSNNNIEYPFLEVNMFQKGQAWKTTSNKTIISNHPPLEEITIIAQNTEIVVSPFKTINLKESEGRTTTLKDCKSLQQQNNFPNQILGTLSSQLDRIENKLETPQITTPQFLNRNLAKNCPIFKPIEVGKETIKLLNNLNGELIKCLTKRIEHLNITLKPSISNTKSVNVISQTWNIDQIRSTFEE